VLRGYIKIWCRPSSSTLPLTQFPSQKTMQPNQRDSSYTPSRGSQRYNSYHDLPVPSSAPGSIYNSPNTPSRSFESLAQATIQPPPPPLYTRYDYGSQAGPSAPRPSMHSYSSSCRYFKCLFIDLNTHNSQSEPNLNFGKGPSYPAGLHSTRHKNRSVRRWPSEHIIRQPNVQGSPRVIRRTSSRRRN
jgi:hypothetical protein